MTWRAIVACGLMLGGAAYIAGASDAEAVPPRASFDQFPRAIGSWVGRDAPAFSDEVLHVLGADEYVNRIYSSPQGPVALYIGYYGSQRQGDSIHSPLNCLPGAGWQAVRRRQADITVPSGGPGSSRAPIRVNQVVVQKGLDRQTVIYWYQSHGRVVADEYWSKLFMVYDAFRLNRSDAAMVRIVSPMGGSNGDGDLLAVERAQRFVAAMFPVLEKFLPS